MIVLRATILMAFVFSHSLAFCQVVGPIIEVNRFELGYSYKWFSRDMNGPEDFYRKLDWSIPTGYMKCGIIRGLALSAEISLTRHEKNKIDETNYRGYTIGAGLTYLLVNINDNYISVSAHVIERFGFDKSSLKNHQGSISILSSLQIERHFRVYNQQVALWIAPAFIYDEYKFYFHGQYLSDKFVAKNKFGLIFGINPEIRNHIRPFFHVVYADYLQPRVGIGYKF